MTKIKTDDRLTKNTTIAYDGSYSEGRMAASISVFVAFEEIFTETISVHVTPSSSTRAEIYGVVMCLEYALQLQRL